MNTDRLHQLIDLYFEGNTTLGQEQELRRLIAAAREPLTPEIEAAKAVLSYTAAMSEVQEPVVAAPRRHAWLPAVAASVSVLVAVAIGWMLVGNNTAKENSCIAYVGSEKIESSELIMEMMSSQLGSISDAQDIVDEEMNEQKNAISKIFNQL